MSRTRNLLRDAVIILRLLANIAGAAMLLLVLAFLVGEGPPNPFTLPTRQLIMMIFFFSACVGLALALWKQLIGGIITLFAMAGFFIANGRFPLGLAFVAITAIGLLNIICSQLKK